MANTFNLSTLVAKDAAAYLRVMNSFLNTGYRKYENMFHENPYKPGDSINVRRDNFFVGSRGDSVTAEDILEESYAVTIGPLYSIPITYTPTDLDRKFADFSQEVIMPAVRRLSSMINRDIVIAGLTEIDTYVGSAASNLNTFASIDQINPVMDSLAIDPAYKRYLSLAPIEAQQVRSASTLQNSFVSPLNKDITMDASLGRLANFDIFSDQSITTFTAGTHATATNITVKTAVSSGNTIVLTGVTNGTTFVAGDVIELTGVFNWDPITRASTGYKKQYTVTSGGTAAATDVTITVNETINFSGARKNVYEPTADTEIPAGTVVTVVGDHIPNIAYSERGLIFCMPPLHPMDSPESSVTSGS